MTMNELNNYTMLQTFLSYLMIVSFMIVIIKRKLSPFTSLVIIPLLFTILFILLEIPQKMPVGEAIMSGFKTVSLTGIMLLFAILYFSIMLDAGLFDPVTKKMILLAKGDPMKVLVATSLVAGVVSLNGDGTTTTLICCSAFIPVYRKLEMRLMNLAVLIILQNTIMNLLPWGGPTARVMAVLNVGPNILTYLAPGMIIALLYVIFIVAPSMGRKERRRLGIKTLSSEEINELITITDPEIKSIRRPKNWFFNAVLTITVIALLIADSFISFGMPPVMVFLTATVIALLFNYPDLKTQSERIGANGGDAVQVVMLIFAAGVFMGLFQGSGMADAIAKSFTEYIPKVFSGYWGLIVALLSAPGTFFISNDGFYFGVLPVLAEAGRAYGFTNMQIALASLMGQAFHLLSPLVAFIYLLLSLTGLDMGKWQIESAKWAIGIFLIFILTILLTGQIPFYIPQVK